MSIPSIPPEVAADSVGRILSIASFTALSAIRLHFRRRNRLQTLDHPVAVEGRGPVAFRVFAYVIIAAGLVRYYLFPTIPPSAMSLPLVVRVVGLASAIASLRLLVRTHRTLGAGFSRTLRLAVDHRLVTEGPYRRVRHPMYAAFLWFFVSQYLITGDALIVVPCLIVILQLLLVRGRAEEAMLRSRFGRRYDEYRSQTGIVFPRAIASLSDSAPEEAP